MTDDVVERAREALDGITEGEWSARTSEATMDDRQHYRFGPEGKPAIFQSPDMRRADAEFIAAASALVRDLADEVERLEAWRAEALAMNARLQDLGMALGVALDSLDRVREALSGHPACDVHPGDDPITCGWKRAVADIRRALDGGA